MTVHRYEPKPRFVERIKLLLNNQEDVDKFFEYCKTFPKKSLRANTLKITPEDLVKRLKEKNWEINQPCPNHPEIIQIAKQLLPGEIGKTQEHILGYYYVQEITSMMPILALHPSEEDTILDLCAAPGSKTSQAAALMKNKGTIIANDLSIGRIKILSANLERCSVANSILTCHDGIQLCKRLKEKNLSFDKILVDAPCSGEGNVRLSPRTLLEWSEPMLKSMSNRQKKLAYCALELLKVNGEMVYSTCTHAPEENEEIVDYLLNNFDIKIEEIKLPIKSRPGITQWQGKTFNPEVKHCHRIYHHDNDMEGFFVCKLKKLSDKIKGAER